MTSNAASETIQRQRLHSFNEYRSLLFAIAYRMLGSMADVEDIVQETFIRWHQTSEVKIESPRALLVTILTRLAINHLQSARVKREEYFGNWLPEPIVMAPGQNPSAAFEIDKSVSLAFLLLLERFDRSTGEMANYANDRVFPFPARIFSRSK